MATDSKSSVVPGKAPTDQPLIPETILDAPTQRLYVLSLGLLFQASLVFQ